MIIQILVDDLKHFVTKVIQQRPETIMFKRFDLSLSSVLCSSYRIFNGITNVLYILILLQKLTLLFSVSVNYHHC